MANFDIGETVICSIEIRDDKDALKDPKTSMNIEISQVDAHAIIIALTAMTNDGIGKYHYDFASAGNRKGKYIAKYIADDGIRITIEKETFFLE